MSCSVETKQMACILFCSHTTAQGPNKGRRACCPMIQFHFATLTHSSRTQCFYLCLRSCSTAIIGLGWQRLHQFKELIFSQCLDSKLLCLDMTRKKKERKKKSKWNDTHFNDDTLTILALGFWYYYSIPLVHCFPGNKTTLELRAQQMVASHKLQCVLGY